MKIIKGKGLGRKLGFPTINFKMRGEKGVFLVRVDLEGEKYWGAMHRGDVAEVYLLGFKGNAYGKEVSVEVVEKLRESWKFETLEGLRRQIALDIDIVKEKVKI